MAGNEAGTKEFGILRFHGGDRYPVEDAVAREEPLEVRLNGRTLVYLMRLPGDDPILAAGFCFSEGLISSRGQVERILCGSGGADAGSQGARPGSERPEREGAAACDFVDIEAGSAEGAGRFDEGRVIRTGSGGADLLREVDLSDIHVESDAAFSPEVILKAPDLMLQNQEVFRTTGGTHAAGIFDTSGGLVVAREDVGRHNAVDKVLGYLLLEGGSMADKGLVLSGRVSYEMVLKAARAGIPLVCSLSAPTSLGVEAGLKTGVTVVGFLRGSGFNVYSHPERIAGSAPSFGAPAPGGS